ncbi:MAG: restriction endonuclease subunit S [Dyadobacter sp.]|uniref:restriction endonuclease subunit S n=1 Tax=Dyadobacter sp. TaxID=1914288 RepID=UPI001B263469|nr:restriction endonuclease subunit S [Dyadobacter sp.]MBO9616010.1 restriction endonuclease subunit S [Dyadobacter sp.]
MNNKKDKLLPELRFPEFRSNGEWDIEPLGILSKEITEKTKGRKFKLMSITSGIGLVSQIEKFGREIAGDSYNNYYVIHAGDFAYNRSSTKLYPEGEVAMFEDEEVGAVPNSIFTCFRFDRSKVYPKLAKYQFTNNLHGKWLKKFISVGARANGALQVNVKDLFSTPFPFPKLPEQQKIASCLSSLDEVIAAHNQKLEALKEHKKGLMQNLFPQEGETVPKMRFPEFLTDGEWVEDTLGEQGMFLKGKGIAKSDIAENGSVPCIRYGELYTYYNETISVVKSYTNLSVDDLVLSRTNDVIIPASGETHDDIATASCVLKDGIALGGDLNIIRTKINGVFLSYYLNNIKKKKISQLAQGIAVVHLYSNQLKKLKINVPKPREQRKIAECLSDLDTSISARIYKIEQLKLHKIGLMQQLFPKPVK